MKAQITITWNPDTEGETSLKYSEAWRNLSNLEKADNLQDAIGILTAKYNSILDRGLV